MDKHWQPWGSLSVTLRLPVAAIRFEQLSGCQRDSVRGRYGPFVDSVPTARGAADIVCHARRLCGPLAVPAERFCVNGQYTIKKRRLDSVIEFAGFEFVAHLDCRRHPAVSASLAVAQEKDFGLGGVIDNFLRVTCAYEAVQRGGALLHSAGVVVGDSAYLFVGHSNVGKSTLTRKAAVAGMTVLSDDMNLVVAERGEFWVGPVVFTGEFGRGGMTFSARRSLRLGGLILLEQAPTLTVQRVGKGSAVARLLANCPFVNDDADQYPVLMDVLPRLVTQTPVIRLGVAREDLFDSIMHAVLGAFGNA